MRILITGATGLIGAPLTANLLRNGHRVSILTRSSRRAAREFEEAEIISWDAISEPPPVRLIDGSEAVIHLAGQSVADGRWTKQRKEAIRDSRVHGTRNLVQALKNCKNKPRVLLNASAIGFYGNRGDEELDETSGAGQGFLAEVGERWEKEALAARELGIRVALLRTGLVLDAVGGALPRMAGIFRKFIGGRVGNGRQWMSWIHIDDQVRSILQLLETDTLDGPVNLTAPNPVNNREFTRHLAKALKRPALFPAPSFALRLLMGEMARELLLQGQRVLPRKLESSGFEFRHPHLPGALEALLA